MEDTGEARGKVTRVTEAKYLTRWLGLRCRNSVGS